MLQFIKYSTVVQKLMEYIDSMGKKKIISSIEIFIVMPISKRRSISHIACLPYLISLQNMQYQQSDYTTDPLTSSCQLTISDS